MHRTLLLALAAALPLALVADPAHAQRDRRMSLQVEGAADLSGRKVVDGVVWTCEAGTCTAPAMRSQPAARLCARAAKELGKLAAFDFGEAPFDAAALARCNESAES